MWYQVWVSVYVSVWVSVYLSICLYVCLRAPFGVASSSSAPALAARFGAHGARDQEPVHLRRRMCAGAPAPVFLPVCAAVCLPHPVCVWGSRPAAVLCGRGAASDAEARWGILERAVDAAGGVN